MNIEKTLFLISTLYYIYNYGPPPLLLNYILYLHHISSNFFIFYNKIIQPEYWNDDVSKIDLLNDNNNISVIEDIPTKKYEDKYLDEIRKMNKEWEFTEEEIHELPNIAEQNFKSYIHNKNERIEEITKEIIELEKEISENEDDSECRDYFDEEGNQIYRESLENRNDERRKKIKILQEEYNEIKLLIDTEDGVKKLKDESEKNALLFFINKRIDKLENCFVMEKTPIGNVLMLYDKSMGKFKYYSDASMPYRYLEVVGRKFVKIFNCRPIFVDMEEELKLIEEKWENEQKVKKIKQEEESKENEEKNKVSEPKKKNVFAKFKSYNKDAGSKINMVPPPKNSIPSKSVTENKESEKILLKEKANCYAYDGKISNFNFLKKTEKKVFNKKLGISFAEFKKMNKK